MHDVIGKILKILRLLALAVFIFFPFRLIIDISALWLAAASVRTFPAPDYHILFLIFYWPRKLIIVAVMGLGCLSLFYSCASAVISFCWKFCLRLKMRMSRITCKQASKRSGDTWKCQAGSSMASKLGNTRGRIIHRYLYYLFDNTG